MIDYLGQCYLTKRIQVRGEEGLAFLAGQPAIFLPDEGGGPLAPKVLRARGHEGERFAGVFAATSLASISAEELIHNPHFRYSESTSPTLLMGHSIVPTDCYDVSQNYKAGDPLFANGSSMWTTVKRFPESRPMGVVFSAPTKDYPFLTVEFATPVLASYLY